MHHTLAFGVSKAVNGGAGTDTLSINYSGVAKASDLSWSYHTSTETHTGTDSNGGIISFTGIENLSVGSNDYAIITEAVGYGGSAFISWGYAKNILWSSDNQDVVMYSESTHSSGATNTAYVVLSSLAGRSGGVAVTGSEYGDRVKDTSGTGGNTINTGAGDDAIEVLNGSGDSINAGPGDDWVWANASDLTADTLIDGGSGTDWLVFQQDGSGGMTYTINDNVAVNFENLLGTLSNDTLTGNSIANEIRSNNGNDIVYGKAGNDILYGDIDQNSSGWPSSSGMVGDTGQYEWYYNSGSNASSSRNGNDALYGGSGNDTLYGGGGEDTLDGGIGTDTLTGGGDSDTFVIRSGDGGSSISDADTITDFTDGTDLIGLDNGLTFGGLNISQGSGAYANDVLVEIDSSDEFLLIIQNIAVSKINALDFSSTNTENQTLAGTSDNDTLIGGAGNDIFNGGSGNDTLVGQSGNDTFNITSKSGSYSDSVYGGAGTDTLSINYSGVAKASDLSWSYHTSTETHTGTDSNGGIISFTGIENLSVGSNDYAIITEAVGYGGSAFISWGYAKNILWSSDNQDVVMYSESTHSSGATNTAYVVLSSLAGRSGGVAVTGSEYGDRVKDTSGTGGNTINTGAGDDAIEVLNGSGDSINAGPGDDWVWANASDLTADTLIDGGSGTDWLVFQQDGSGGMTYTINDNVAVNFENLLGTLSNDTLTGNSIANEIRSNNGNDIVYGKAGNDILYGDIDQNSSGWPSSSGMVGDTGQYEWYYNSGSNASSSRNGNDALYGGSGNDTLYGGGGEDTLDGGIGTDTLTGGGDSDTFVIRSGDGGSSISDADTITDFTDGTDIIGMSGLNFSDLKREQGTGSYSSHVVIKKTSTGEFLIIIQNTNLSDIDDKDFSAI